MSTPASPPDPPALAQLATVRHGQSRANVAFLEAAESGRDPRDLPDRDADVALSDLGEKQARQLGENWLARLPPADHPRVVYTSPYARARRTAELALAAAGRTLPVHVDERLRDREMGVLELLTPDQIRRRYPEEARRRQRVGDLAYRPPGGESLADVALRTRSALRDLHERHAAERVLVLAHDATVLMARMVIDHLDEARLARVPGARNAAVTRWAFASREVARMLDDDVVTHLASP